MYLASTADVLMGSSRVPVPLTSPDWLCDNSPRDIREQYGKGIGPSVACVASVSVQFRSKERGAGVEDRAKNGTCKAFYFLVLV